MDKRTSDFHAISTIPLAYRDCALKRRILPVGSMLIVSEMIVAGRKTFSATSVDDDDFALENLNEKCFRRLKE